MQSEISTTALVGYRKTITSDSDIPFPDDRKTDAARSDDDNAAIASAVGTDAGDRCIMRVNDRLKRVWLLYEVFERPFAAHASKADGRVH
jgi:hypothetical protein